MTWLAEVAARSAKRAATMNFTGPNATDFVMATTTWTGDTTIETAVETPAQAKAQDATPAEEPEPAAALNVETHTGTVHTAYRTVKRGRTILMPDCDRFGNPARYHYLADTTRAVTCKKCSKHLGGAR